MDLLEACENLAANVTAFDVQDAEDAHVSDADLHRWQSLFAFSRDKANDEISQWRADFGRETVTQAVWEAIKDSKVTAGFDKESYEYSISGQRQRYLQNAAVKPKAGGSTVLVKVHGYLSSSHVMQQLLEKDKVPTVLPATDDDGYAVNFCLLTGAEATKLVYALKELNIDYQPTIVRVSIASKDLSPESYYPTLGIDTTLPQYRPNAIDVDAASPSQNEFPVWYFFYGTLADQAVLSRVTGLQSSQIIYKSARVSGARLSTWGGKYLGIVDAPASSIVSGWAYLVTTRDEEEALRVYETDTYMVVRCRITMDEDGLIVKGLTFRLV